MKRVKESINRILGRFGFRIVNAEYTLINRRMRLLRHLGVSAVLDVGANTGQYGRQLRELGYGGRIVSFEPVSDAFAELAARCAGDPLWECHRIGLGNEEGSASINIASNSVSSSLLDMEDAHVASVPSSSYCRQETIVVRTLDAFLAERPELSREAKFLKIDTQGYEMQVLGGASGSLSAMVGIQLEMSLEPLYKGQMLFKEMYERLEGLGFVMAGFEPAMYDQATGRMLQVDGIFVRKDALGRIGVCAS